ncbi:hypothetical protein FRC12_015440 [Ceratobasidium sp. 428]|nr:hypothetical protein FRC12_015440 [Ceratobasidium sp. 428]
MDYSVLKRNRTSEHSQATALSLPSVFTELKLAHATLTTAIQSYRASCVKLIATSATPVHQLSQHLTAKNVLAAVDSELELLASEKDTLQKLRASLRAARKKLAVAMPLINELPAEILVNVFTLLSPCYTFRKGLNLYNFTRVCTHWRRIALNTLHLWTHVDVGPSVPAGLTKALLDRAKGTPIHIHLKEIEPRSTHPRYPVAHQILPTLAPHIHWAHTLEIQSYLDSPANFTALLSLWLQKGSSSLAKSLMVYRSLAFARGLLSFNTSSMDELGGWSENTQAMMRSLSCLHLQNVHFDWDSSAYYGLVDLQLSCSSGPAYVSISQLANVLSANPALTTLKLRSLTITSSDNEPPPAPIVLNHLQLLCLSYIRPNTKLLLPLLALTNPSVKVSIAPHNFSDIYSELESLVIRSHIAELYCSQEYKHIAPGVWRSFLGLPGPLSLILHQFSLEENLVAEELVPTLSTCPLDITLSDCYVNPEGLKAIVARSNVQSLCLAWCRMLQDDDDWDDDGLLMSGFDFEEYPELQAKCSISEVFMDPRWDCYKVFGEE